MCSYCGCRSLTPIARLTSEHEEIVEAAGELRRAAEGADMAAVRSRAATLAGLLHPHTATEERGLFAELRRDPEFTEHVDALCAEHTDLDAALDRVVAGELGALPGFLHQLRRHIEREENGLFPAAAIALDDAAWDRVVEVSGAVAG